MLQLSQPVYIRHKLAAGYSCAASDSSNNERHPARIDVSEARNYCVIAVAAGDLLCRTVAGPLCLRRIGSIGDSLLRQVRAIPEVKS